MVRNRGLRIKEEKESHEFEFFINNFISGQFGTIKVEQNKIKYKK